MAAPYELRVSSPGCPFTAGDPPDTCRGCATPLPRRKDGQPWTNRVWCSTGECQRTWQREHVWAFAREAALKRDGCRCVRRDVHEAEEKVRQDLAGSEGLLAAREEFLRRVGRLNLEVNHIVPRRGDGYAAGCHHHLTNLETLCRPHHVEETRRQRLGLPTWRQDPRDVDDLLARAVTHGG